MPQESVNTSSVAYTALPTPREDVEASAPVRSHNFCLRDHRNRPQPNAVGAAALIFVSGGMNLAWSIGFSSISDWLVVSIHMRICWFVAAIFGALIGVVLAKRLSYKLLVQGSALLVIAGGISLSIGHHNAQALMAGRYLNGLANGLIFAPTLALLGELSVSYKRGSIASHIEHFACLLGIYMQITFTVSWDSDNKFTQEQVLGIVNLVFGAMAVLTAWLCSVESPVQLLAQGQEQGAINALSTLQYPPAVTAETYDQLEEHRRYLAHNVELGWWGSWRQALPALLRLCLLRGLYAMSNCFIVVFAATIFNTSTFGIASTPYMFFGLLRLLSSALAGALLDWTGRRPPLLLGLLVSGGLASSIARLCQFDQVVYIEETDLKAAAWLILCYQFFAGLSFTPTSAYLSEAFPLAVKRPCIALAYITELMVQLIICCVDIGAIGIDLFPIYFYVLSGFLLLAFLLGLAFVPETKMLTLRQAQQKFCRFLPTAVQP